ncbi:Mg2+-importing ATPase [Paucimonas lemoignei]|uniref:Magnesium-transporting ATPase, P-type 1 n=1 Tax=Paucimonas lemoignei TaxID=29443 RepID=A0A4R3I3J4_PAULE|nr:magnesium-translocating P-type ATPase [Paucimonas lemoignei]TCS39401.1 Mg2+-importing ATPase [Paucimonas lemoignei]
MQSHSESRLASRHAIRFGRGEFVDGGYPWWRYPIEENMAAVEASSEGLTPSQVQERLACYGKNSFRDVPPPHILLQFLHRFNNPLVLLLLFAGAISAATGNDISAAIIATMVLLSVLLDFIQEYRAGKTAEMLKQSVALRASVLRGGKLQEVDAQTIVPGDIVLLRAGQLVPADGRVLTAQDFFVQQAAITGEAYPVEKNSHSIPATDELQAAENAVFMGSSVVSGQATVFICATGSRTAIGHVAQAVAGQRVQTAFEQEIHQFGRLILRITSVLIAFVVLVNLLTHRPLLESFLFALALAVGLTPELLPMIVTVTLTRGALRLSQKHVVVKRLSAIHDLGAIDIFCTDKTGTLTEGSIRLERHLDIHGNSNESVLLYAWLNCFFESGVRTPMEDAVLAHESIDASAWRKIDEVPFDFERRRLSVLLSHGVQEGERRWLILKGAPSDVLAHCTLVWMGGEDLDSQAVPMDAQRLAQVNTQLTALERDGFRTLIVAIKEMPVIRDHARLDDEDELTLLGILAFLDPPKSSATAALEKLAHYAVKVKVLTGDSELVTEYICKQLKLPASGVVMGHEIAQMDDAALRARVETADLFCRVSPMQKNRVILALKASGHVIGYLGDGINDAPALHNADVGISVDKAVDVAREAADLILLKHDLGVIAGGILEGRRTFSNVRKYIMMGASSNFGNMFSMAGAVVFLPFLPMLPVQILLNNILYDLAGTVLPFDQVDRREMLIPQKWDMRFLFNFMLVMGPLSSFFDFLTFYFLFQILHANAQTFQTGWFIESLATQILVIFIIRTRLSPIQSRPHPALILTSLVILIISILIPNLSVGRYLGFVELPLLYYGMLGLLVLVYLVVAEIAKKMFYKRFDLSSATHNFPSVGTRSRSR